MDHSALQGRVALVTGGSGGIGRALVRRIAAAGCDVAVAYSTDAGGAADAVGAAQESGVRAVALAADLSDAGAVTHLVDQVRALLGEVDVLVPNAGTATRADLEAIDTQLWQRTLAVNLTAPFLLAQGVVPGMAARGFGRVLFTSSVAAFTGGIVGPHYAASKAGLHGLVHWLAANYAAAGVTVNAIAPALVAGTQMFPGADEDAARVPIGRFGRTDEVADLAVAMLANGYLTDKIYLLDGGMHPQ